MTTPFDATLGSPPLTRSGPAGELDTPTARAVLGYALGLGVAADSLLRNGPDGVAFSVWIALLLVSTVSLCWRTAQPIRREAAAWLFTAAVFSLGLAWRDSELLRVFDLFATAVALVAAAVTLSDQRWRLGAARAFDVIAASLAVARDTVAGIIPVAL